MMVAKTGRELSLFQVSALPQQVSVAATEEIIRRRRISATTRGFARAVHAGQLADRREACIRAENWARREIRAAGMSCNVSVKHRGGPAMTGTPGAKKSAHLLRVGARQERHGGFLVLQPGQSMHAVDHFDLPNAVSPRRQKLWMEDPTLLRCGRPDREAPSNCGRASSDGRLAEPMKPARQNTCVSLWWSGEMRHLFY